MKIVSLLPSATEIVYALGLGDDLVAVSHECDYPPAARSKPKITRALVNSDLSGQAIDHDVRGRLHEAGTLYDLDYKLLDQLRPDVILTQRLCNVCAVSYDEVRDAVGRSARSSEIVNLEPRSVGDILENIRDVGRLAGRWKESEEVIRNLQSRIERVRNLASKFRLHPKIFLMEWINPPYGAGHWNGELIQIAGGIDRLAGVGQPSRRVEWREILEFGPEIVVISCCGFSIERTLKEIPDLQKVKE